MILVAIDLFLWASIILLDALQSRIEGGGNKWGAGKSMKANNWEGDAISGGRVGKIAYLHSCLVVICSVQFCLDCTA